MISRRALTVLCARQSVRFMLPRSPLLKEAPVRTFIPMPKKEDRLRAAILLGGPVITFFLGVWQVKRLYWKREIIDRLQSTLNLEPVKLEKIGEDEDLNEVFSRLPEYRRVKVRGRFDHSREIYIRPRPLVDRTGKPAGSSGAHVITPFILSSPVYPKNVRGKWILINRGWVDFQHMDPQTRQSAQVDAEMEFVGVVRKSEAKMSPLIQKDIADQKNVVWAQRNVELMSDVLGTAPLFIDADFNSTIPGGPMGGQTIMSVRNQHLSYIFTWWSLSAATAYIWFRTFIRPVP